MLPELRHHVHIARRETGTRRELCIAREVSCDPSGTVSVRLRLSNEEGQHTELLVEMASGSNGRRSPRHDRTLMRKEENAWALAVRSLHSTFGGSDGLCVGNGDVRGLWVTLS